VLTVLVLEVVVDTLLIHQAADEVKIRLPVLDAIGPAVVVTTQGRLEIRIAVLAEDGLEDIRDRLFLKDTTVGGAGERLFMDSRLVSDRGLVEV